jgi:hypothetical protein
MHALLAFQPITDATFIHFSFKQSFDKILISDTQVAGPARFVFILQTYYYAANYNKQQILIIFCSVKNVYLLFTIAIIHAILIVPADISNSFFLTVFLQLLIIGIKDIWDFIFK